MVVVLNMPMLIVIAIVGLMTAVPVAVLATRHTIVITTALGYSVLALGALIVLSGCASSGPTPRPMDPAYDPSRSHAANLAAAAGLSIRDAERSDVASGELFEAARTGAFLATTTLRPATGLTRPGAFGLGLLATLGRPRTIPLEMTSQALVWAPIDSGAGEEPIELYWLDRVATAIFEARAATLPSGYTQASEPDIRRLTYGRNLIEQINEVDLGYARQLEVRIEGADCDPEAIRCSDRLRTSVPSFFGNVAAPDYLNDDQPRTLVAIFLSPTFQEYTGFRNLFHPRFDDIQTLVRASEALPDSVYFYIAPSRMAYFNPETNIHELVRAPLIIHQGQIYPFVSPS